MAKILVAGKNPSEREIQALIVEFGGHTCVTAGSLKEAVNLLQKGFFDLVVAESSLCSNGSSDYLVQCLGAASRNVGVLVLAERGANLKAGDEVLPIPCSPEDLIERIAQGLGKLARVRAKSIRVKRRFARYPVHLPCRVKALRRSDASNGAAVHTVTKNISRGGLYLIATGDWKVGAQIECVVELPSRAFGDRPKWIRSQGRIVHAAPQDRGASGVGATIDRFEFVDQPEK